ncbi:MAG: hypothetical protein JNL74_22710 [Fibrobacteres bacterium]|nr:hypothetical protein [Fibrobacterota bacterium]
MNLKALKRWFVIHFITDFAIAIPLFLFPEYFLTFMGWSSVDPLMTRLVASALFGIGGISLIAKNSSKETFKTLLNLKIIWSLSAITALIIALIRSNYPPVVWLFLIIFILFSATWIYFRTQIDK